MALILNPLLGRHITKCWLQQHTVNESTGALTSAGAGGLIKLVTTTGSLAGNDLGLTIGIVDSIQLMSDKDVDNISSAQRALANHVALKTGYTMVISENLHSGADVQLLAGLFFPVSSKYAEVTFGRGGNRWVIMFLMTDYVEDIQRGKNVGVLTLRSVAVGGIGYTANEQ